MRASTAVLSASISIPCCRFPPSCPLGPSPHSQQQFSLWARSPVPMHQLPASLHTCEHMSQSRAHRAEIWTGPSVHFSFCPVCHRSATSPSSDSLKCFPPVPIDFPVERGFPLIRESLLCFSSPNLGCRSHPASSPPPPSPFFFFCPTQLCRDLYSLFWCPRSSASFQLVFCENCCIYRCIPDAFVERDELHFHLLLRHLKSPIPSSYLKLAH